MILDTTSQNSIEGIDASSDPNSMVFTHRYSQSNGFGVLKVENSDPLSFSARINKSTNVDLNFPQINFREARSVTITSDNQYAFVLGYQGSQQFRGFNLISENPNSPMTIGQNLGTTIGIIQNPLTNPQLIAMTRPIPMGLGVDLSLTSDDKHLIATYPGVQGLFVFDVNEIRRTIANPSQFMVDSRTNSGTNYSLPQDGITPGKHLGFITGGPATSDHFKTMPIDDINPLIDIGARFEVVKYKEGTSINGPFVEDIAYGVPNDARLNAPIGRGGNPRSVDSAARLGGGVTGGRAR